LDEEQHQQAAGEVEKVQNSVMHNLSLPGMQFRMNIKLAKLH